MQKERLLRAERREPQCGGRRNEKIWLRQVSLKVEEHVVEQVERGSLLTRYDQNDQFSRSSIYTNIQVH